MLNNRAASRMSCSRPSWFASIEANGRDQNIVPRETIRRSLDGSAEHEIHGGADQLLSLSGHFEQAASRRGPGLVQGHQKIDIALGGGQAPGCGAEDLQAANSVLFAKGAKHCPEFGDRQRGMTSFHGVKLTEESEAIKADEGDESGHDPVAGFFDGDIGKAGNHNNDVSEFVFFSAGRGCGED